MGPLMMAGPFSCPLPGTPLCKRYRRVETIRAVVEAFKGLSTRYQAHLLGDYCTYLGSHVPQRENFNALVLNWIHHALAQW